VQELLIEVRELSSRAIERARLIAWVGPPDHLDGLVGRIRDEHGGKVAELHAAVDRRLAREPVRAERGVFYAASELALIESVWRDELEPEDRSSLRDCWEHLRAA
jgi:hypothetical protein